MFNTITKEAYRKIILTSYKLVPITIDDKSASDLVRRGLEGDKPFLCDRIGCTELQTIIFARKAQKSIRVSTGMLGQKGREESGFDRRYDAITLGKSIIKVN